MYVLAQRGQDINLVFISRSLLFDFVPLFREIKFKLILTSELSLQLYVRLK